MFQLSAALIRMNAAKQSINDFLSFLSAEKLFVLFGSFSNLSEICHLEFSLRHNQ